MSALLDELRATAASLADLDHAPDHIEVNPRGVSALLTRAAKAIEDAEAALASCDATRQRNAEHYRDACNGLATMERELSATVRLRAEVATLTKERDDARADFDSAEYDAAKVAVEWERLGLDRREIAFVSQRLADAISDMVGNGRDGWAEAAIKRAKEGK